MKSIIKTENKWVIKRNFKQIVSENHVLTIMRNVPMEKFLHYTGAVIDGGFNFFEVALNSANALEEIIYRKLGNPDEKIQ